MKTRIFIIMVIGLLMAATRASSGDCGPKINSATAKAVYAAVIDDCIARCQSKVLLIQSRSARIRRGAQQAIMKWAFLTANRDALVQYLASRHVNLHPVRIQYHLNCRFCQFCKAFHQFGGRP